MQKFSELNTQLMRTREGTSERLKRKIELLKLKCDRKYKEIWKKQNFASGQRPETPAIVKEHVRRAPNFLE